jgi:uncharacterized membrane-anchored protein
VFAGVIGAIALAYFLLKANAVLSFWLTYIMTRPLGASLGDLLSAPTADGGLGLGAGITAAIFLSIILVVVIFLRWVQGAPAHFLHLCAYSLAVTILFFSWCCS